VTRFIAAAALLLAAIGLSTSASTPPDIVLRASEATLRAGAWTVVSDPTAAGEAALRNPDAGAAKLTVPLANPTNFFELTFDAAAATPYHLWIRGKADKNSWANDSVYVQFSDDLGPTAMFGRGTTSAATVSIEDCTNCGVAGWGWQDHTYGGLAPNLVFDRAGQHTIRVQVREDGLMIDQIVLSPSTYLSKAPGALKNDNTIVPTTPGGGTPPATFVRQPFLQQLTHSSVKVVWATREFQSGTVQASTGGGGPLNYPATSTPFPASATGMANDYYQYEATVDGLAAQTIYSYKLQMNGADLTSGTDTFTTAPPPGTGTVRFIAFGDSGVGSTEQYALSSLMAADRFDLALHLGDIVYGTADGLGPATYSSYQNWFFDAYRNVLRARPLFPTIGNHDNGLANGQAYRDVFVLPRHGASSAYPEHAERFYSFDYGPAHFISLDTETAFLDPARRQAQLDWLRDDLAATTRDWKIAFFHRPGYSSGAEHRSDLTVRNAFGPIFEQYGVQLVLSGHDHDYERTFPIKTSSDPFAQPVTYVVSGAGGAPLYTVSGDTFTAFARSTHHYVRADVSTCLLTLQPIGLDGLAFDTLSIDRCGTPTPTDEIVVYAQDVPPGNIVGASWSLAADGTAAASKLLKELDRGQPKVAKPVVNPANYVDVPFTAQAGVPYQLWFRMKAPNIASDSIYVQFSGAVNASHQPIYRLTEASAASVILENGSGAGIAGWGWADSSYGSLASPIYFAVSGPQTLRIQSREDGVSIDQIVLSASRYLTAPPGTAKDDTTIVAKP
jgi:hypothetical protein